MARAPFADDDRRDHLGLKDRHFEQVSGPAVRAHLTATLSEHARTVAGWWSECPKTPDGDELVRTARGDDGTRRVVALTPSLPERRKACGRRVPDTSCRWGGDGSRAWRTGPRPPAARVRAILEDQDPTTASGRLRRLLFSLAPPADKIALINESLRRRADARHLGRSPAAPARESP